jgi:hypothetical protein
MQGIKGLRAAEAPRLSLQREVGMERRRAFSVQVAGR